MTKNVPRGDSTLYCPFWRKTLDKVCHTCPLFKHIRGKDANTGEDLDEWACSLAWLPMLMIEVANQSRMGTAATESFRDEVVSISLAQSRSHYPVRAALQTDTKLIEN